MRGQPVAELEANLRTIVQRARAENVRVLLAGMQIPGNFGDAYSRDFAAVYPRIARDAGVALVPFLLEGVAFDPALNLADGIHPNRLGHQRVAETVWPQLLPLLDAPDDTESPTR